LEPGTPAKCQLSCFDTELIGLVVIFEQGDAHFVSSVASRLQTEQQEENKKGSPRAALFA
jgi:hypothetical protein